MGKSVRLTVADFEDVFRLIQECRELWADADAWQAHLLEGARRLTGTAVGVYNELRLSTDGRAVHVIDEVDLGWRDAAARTAFMRMFDDHPNRASFLPRCVRLARAAGGRAGRNDNGGGVVTALRHEMRPDGEWRRSKMFNEYRRPAHLDAFVLSFAANPNAGTVVMLCANQDVTDPPPGLRAKTMLSLLNRQVAPLVGSVLATRRQRGLSGLSARLRQTLERLLAGDSEKQVAASLGISIPTAHEYISAVYRHFGVFARPELMAYFLRRSPEGSCVRGVDRVERSCFTVEAAP